MSSHDPGGQPCAVSIAREGHKGKNAVLNRKTIIVYSGKGCNPKEEVP